MLKLALAGRGSPTLSREFGARSGGRLPNHRDHSQPSEKPVLHNGR